MPETRLRVTVVPGASQNAVARQDDGSYKIRVAAPAKEGKANRELIRYLSSLLDLPRAAVSLQRGATSRHKVVSVANLDLREINRRLESGCRG